MNFFQPTVTLFYFKRNIHQQLIPVNLWRICILRVLSEVHSQGAKSKQPVINKKRSEVAPNKALQILVHPAEGGPYNPTTQLGSNNTTYRVLNPCISTIYCALNIKLRCRDKTLS
jgi:hypothetical protein